MSSGAYGSTLGIQSLRAWGPRVAPAHLLEPRRALARGGSSWHCSPDTCCPPCSSWVSAACRGIPLGTPGGPSQWCNLPPPPQVAPPENGSRPLHTAIGVSPESDLAILAALTGMTPLLECLTPLRPRRHKCLRGTSADTVTTSSARVASRSLNPVTAVCE